MEKVKKEFVRREEGRKWEIGGCGVGGDASEGFEILANSGCS